MVKRGSVKALQAGGEMTPFSLRLEDSGGKTAAAAVMVGAFMIVLLMVLYMIYLIRNRNFGKQVIIKNMINIVDNKNKDLVIKSSTTNSATYSYWIYIASFVPMGSASKPALVWMGTSKYDIKSTNTSDKNATANAQTPIVSMDNSTNRMYASFYLNDLGSTSVNEGKTYNLDALKPSPDNPIGDMRDSISNPVQYLTIPIDYVPLQRWVHYAIVVNQSMITIYQDAQVYAVRASSDLEGYNKVGRPNNGTTRPMFANAVPETILTMNPSNDSQANTKTKFMFTNTQQQNVYLSSFNFYNYAMAQSDIQKEYSKGPRSTTAWLDWLGIGHYKLQSPIVYVKEEEDEKKTT
jgi:hypothetical protein